MSEIPDEAVEAVRNRLYTQGWDPPYAVPDQESDQKLVEAAILRTVRQSLEPFAAAVRRDTAEKIAAAQDEQTAWLKEQAEKSALGTNDWIRYIARAMESEKAAAFARGVAADGQDAAT